MDSIPQTSGIYQILCIPTGKIYIGSAVNLRKRHGAHWAALKRSQHENSYLQHAWDKYGESAFQFSIIELVLEPFLLEREQYWLDKLCPFDRNRGFNRSPSAGSMTGYKMSEATRRKMSEAQKGKPGRSPSLEEREQIAASLRGRKVSSDVIRRISATLRGKPKPEGFGAKQSARLKGISTGRQNAETIERRAAALRGRKRDIETIEKVAASHRRAYYVITPEGEEIFTDNLKLFCHNNALHYETMLMVVRGARTHHKGWKCRLA